MRTAPQIRTSLTPVDGWVKFNCPRCQRELWKTPYEAKSKKQHYCSKLCKNETPLIRLMKGVVKHQGTEPTECWLFNKMLNKDGYGHIKMNGNNERANRASWTLLNGAIPEGLLVLHKCIGTRSCINPDHLYLGTFMDNNRDTIEQGRKVTLRGDDNPCSILTEEEVREIKPLKGVVASSVLSMKYGCSRSAIHNIWYGHNWKHVKIDD